VTVSMRVLSAGDGYRYLLKSVAAGDGNRSLTEPLTRYYTEKGTPPGYWLGSGVSSLGGGRLPMGGVVSEDQIRLLLGLGADPINGEPLGRPYPVYRRSTGPEGQAAKPRRRAVAGFDFTFSVPKSVSVLWAVADAKTQALIAQAHRRAIADVLDLLERDVAVTRVGADAGDGSIAQMEVAGVVATAYDHYDSRSGDPQLHTHVVVANKVRALHDGKWRTLDGRPLHAAVVALSEHYNAVLADHLRRRLGVAWERRERGEGRNPAFELAAVPRGLIEAFSSRSRDIERETDRLISRYRSEHGRDPSPATILKLRQEATLATRPEKESRSLAELTEGWRAEASRLLGTEPMSWARRLVAGDGSRSESVLRATDVSLETIRKISESVLEVVESKRSVWRHWNLHAEASRQVMDWRFASTVDREAVVGLVVDAAEQTSIRLTPPELASSSATFRWADGTSRLRPRYGAWFTSTRILAAEDRLLRLSEDVTAPKVPTRVTERAVAQPVRGHRVGTDQADAIRSIVTSGRVLDVLVGPAGTGKTTALRALRTAWEAAHGTGSVVGLAPSAAAAEVLADDLGIPSENTAKWLWEHRASGWTLRPGQLLIVDEASLAGTLSLDALAGHAAAVGAKVLMVGDPAQLSAVEAGAAFGMVVRHRENPPRLIEVRRFASSWEAHASVRLRDGDATVLEEYIDHRRVHEGDADAILDAAYRAWWADQQAGHRSLLMADTSEAVSALNERARIERVVNGEVALMDAVRLHDGNSASRGDVVITRRNKRRLRTGTGWVRNGDRWIVDATHADGSVTVHRASPRRGRLRLPAEYVATDLELGYAVTVHRAQGSTVHSAHAVISSPTTTRETLYVAMTRGQQGNSVYIATDQPQLEDHQQDRDAEYDARAALTAVLARTGLELSARETLAAEQDRWTGIAQLAAEYDTIAAAAQRGRWLTLLAGSGLTADVVQRIGDSEAFPALSGALRRAESYQVPIRRVLPALIEQGEIESAEDPAIALDAALNAALGRWRRGDDTDGARLIAGLIPEASGSLAPDATQALRERAVLIEGRASAILAAGLAAQAPWTRALGRPPMEPALRHRWNRLARVVAAYRGRYDIGTSTALGGEPVSIAQESDRARAQAALEEARRLDIRRPTAPTRTAPKQTSGRSI
jgi:conjugative relaxase-like TrwC/TraI family protein